MRSSSIGRIIIAMLGHSYRVRFENVKWWWSLILIIIIMMVVVDVVVLDDMQLDFIGPTGHE